MAKKCKKGYKPKKGKCVPDPLYFGITTGDKDTLKTLLIRVVLTISAWGVFWSVISLTGLRESNPWVLLIVSLIIGVVSVRLGLKN